MSRLANAFRRALDEGDVKRFRYLWAYLYPKMPQPQDSWEAEVTLHQARTGTKSLPLAKRLYSHHWLFERGFRSQLPDELRPPVQRVGPPIVFRAVGVAVGSLSKRPDRREEAKELERIMAQAGGEMISMGITDSVRISRRMWEARDLYIKKKLRKEI